MVEELVALADDEDMKRRRRAVADPLRMRILGLLSFSDGGMTAKEIASKLGVNPNGLYYHVRILELAGMIGIVDTRVSGRVVERVYDQVYKGRFVWDGADPLDMSTHLGACLEMSRTEAEEVLFEQARSVDSRTEPPVVTWGMPSFTTTHEDIVEFARRVDVLQMEFRDRAHQRLTESTGTGQHDQRILRFAWLVYEQPTS